MLQLLFVQFPEISAVHLLDMIYIIKGLESFDDLMMGLVFFKLCRAYGYRHRINAESRICISGIKLNIIYFKAESSDGCDKILKL